MEDIVGALICEETKAEVEFKVRDENKNGFVIAEGILQEGNEVNRNRRYYPTQELAAGIMAPKQQELIKSGNFKGEAGHPLDTSLTRQAKIDPTNEQVWYQKLWMDGDYVMAHFRGTNNALGRSFNDDLKDGQKPSFSLRALGSLVNENGKMTVRNMQIITYDRVYFPSHSKAYTTKIITTESADGSASNKEFYIANPHTYFARKQNELIHITESGNCPISGGFVTKFTNQQLANYIIQESANLKAIVNQFDVFRDGIALNENTDTVYIKTKVGDTIVMPLEDHIQKEIMNEVDRLF